MAPILQDLVMYAIVVAAMASALIRFMPKAWRAGLASKVAGWTRGVGLSAQAARRVEAKLASGGACGSCDSCGACAKPAAVPTPGAYPTIPIRRGGS